MTGEISECNVSAARNDPKLMHTVSDGSTVKCQRAGSPGPTGFQRSVHPQFKATYFRGLASRRNSCGDGLGDVSAHRAVIHRSRCERDLRDITIRQLEQITNEWQQVLVASRKAVAFGQSQSIIDTSVDGGCGKSI